MAMQRGLRWALAAAVLVWPSAAVGANAKQPRPNILWLIADDLGVELGCYGDPLVKSPKIDKLAAKSVRFANAFTTAPVCSSSRSAFITGMYQTTIGAHNHRSHRDDGSRLPEGIQTVTDYFRQAGYFTANLGNRTAEIGATAKTDFNFTCEKPFDGADWRERKAGQPFFAQVCFREPHRPFSKASQGAVDPKKVTLPPYYPDHTIAREDWAQYLDAIAALDRHVGAMLARLEEDRLADDTIVFFFGDNGHPHVRGKQWLYDGGIHVPLLVRIPEKFHVAGCGKPGSACDDLVSGIDIPATSLALAGVPVGPKMEGRNIFSADAKPREFVVAARDRCGETVDRIRCIRTKKYKYIRNFCPERPYTQPNRYKEQQYPVLALMKQLHAEGKLNPIQELFMAPCRPAEELYDLQSDPHEVKNLAGDPKHAEALADLRAKLNAWMHQTDDQGGVAEDPAVLEHWQKVAEERGASRPTKRKTPPSPDSPIGPKRSTDPSATEPL